MDVRCCITSGDTLIAVMTTNETNPFLYSDDGFAKFDFAVTAIT